MIAMCFLRCLLLFSAVINVSHQVSVFHETPNISETDQCQLSCGSKEQLPLTEIDGGFYHFYVNAANKKSWHEAYDFCRQHNMELVTIETAAENEAIKQKINGLKDGEYCWIGLNSIAKQGEFRWASTGKAATFTDWHQTQPSSPSTDRCVEFLKFGNGEKWNDAGCHTENGRFICEVTSQNLLYMHAN